jgi:ABC-type multidrug transport system ATPase subunit
MLEITDLSKTYANGVRALDSVSLTADRGLFGLLGPNGAGKSTLMRTIATLQPPDTGHVRLDGRDAYVDPRAHRRRLGYLPQEHGVYPGVSAIDLLDHLAVLKDIVDRAERREQVEALLQHTNLFQHRHKAVASFSGGMRRRFGIAQALLGDPRLVIVDEPTAGLDPEERRRFHDVLVEVGDRAIVLLSTHIVADVEQLCSQVAVLSGGRVIDSGEPSTLVERLRGRLWQRAVERADVAAVRESLPVLSVRLRAGRSHVVVLADHPPGEGFTAVTADLEDAYFASLFGATSASARIGAGAVRCGR